MSVRTSETLRLSKEYGNDRKKLLSENPSLLNLYAFSDARESLVEWFHFEPGKSLLEAGADQGALVSLFLKKGLELTVLDQDTEELSYVAERARAEGTDTGRLHTFCGELSALPESTQFDYIFFDGTLGKKDAAIVAAAKKHLKQDGILLAAADNSYGLRVFAGARAGQNAMNRSTLEALLQAGENGKIRRYYPEHDRKLPATIWSDAYLPGRGDLSRVLYAYDFPKYLVLDISAKYDEIAEDETFPDFADAFLFLWSRKEIPENTIFVKYNRNRKESYQLKTVIRRTPEGDRSSEKTALCDAGREHIGAFQKRYEILSKAGDGLRYVKPLFSEDGKTVSFPWISGKSLSEETADQIRSGKNPVTVINAALERILGTEKIYNRDSIFDNFLLTPDGLCGIDYEWVSEEPAEKAFIRYRALADFYEKETALFPSLTRQGFLALFNISSADADRFAEEETAFQNGIAGDEQEIFLDHYWVGTRDLKQIREDERELAIVSERLEGLKAELGERDTEIRKMTEVKRLTDNHVTNLGVIIQDLRKENTELGKTLTYLNGHQTLTSKVRRKLGDSFNKRYPKGSVERKKLDYMRMQVQHPVAYHKLVSTAEGKNLIEGDFRIGSIYKQYGKLKFPKTENPLVSIVIPCYNQVGYTYACLQSVLEYTKDLPYEVIIADDVSTDATRDLPRFAENLIISRNETNQGFLRNCNRAAAKARGKFIMFLNNDTKVTAGWLSSLLELMDAHPDIGMTGSKLVYPDGRLQEAGGIIWSDGSGWNYGRMENPALCEFNYVKDVDYISGAAILIRSALWKEIGGFDDRYAPAYCEDSDLAFEVRKHGCRVVYQPKSVVIHFEGISNGTDVQGTGLKRYQTENAKKLCEKWKEELKNQFENDGNPDPFRARERSRGKRIILVVDHYVPTYDKDAGSKTTWQYLNLFLEEGFEVKFLGDNFAHEEPYTTELEQRGIEVLYGPEMQTGIWDWIERHEKDLWLVYLNRPHIASRYIDFIQSRTRLKVIYYGHDLHFLRERREYELTGDRKLKESSDYWRAVELGLMRKADMSYYPSEIECRGIHAIDPEIRVKAITAYVWDRFPEDIPENFAGREGILFVGGFAHPPNADGVLWFVKEIWPLIRAHKKMNFYIVGSHETEEIKALHDPDNGIFVKGFVTEEELRKLYDQCRLTAVPLRYGAGVKGKVIEALYYGLPVVTTSVGAEGIPDAEQVMKIADTPEAFSGEVLKLYDAPETLSRMSEEAQTYIRNHNSVKAAWEVIRKDFEERNKEVHP